MSPAQPDDTTPGRHAALLWCAGGGSRRRLVVWLCAVAVLAALHAQEPSPDLPPDVARAIQEGHAETLEARFRGAAPDEHHWIAQAYANRARRARTPPERDRALDRAEERYRRWIDALAGPGRADDRTAVAVAGARAEYAGLLLGLRAAAELDAFEISGGQRGDREKLARVLTAARDQYAQAATVINRLYEQLQRREEEFLTAGIYDTIVRLWLDIAFNDGWTHYYLGLIEAPDAPQRQERLRAAERRFQTLLDSGQTGRMLHQCHLGAAVAQRELRQWADAERNFAAAMQAGVEPGTEAQARCELARCHLAGGKFDKAREVLAALIAPDPRELNAADRELRFYSQLALLLDANSHLLEAAALRTEALASPAQAAILRRADRARETGLAKFNRLAARGGLWPGLVQLYIAGSVNLRADPATLTPLELLYTARQLADAKHYRDALRRLEEAAKRPEFHQPPAQRSEETTDLGGQILMELGRCYYRAAEQRQAADAFDRLARAYRAHPQAPQAATFAYQLRLELARKSQDRADYARLAEALLNLLQNFPDHPEREEAVWLLPVAYQAAGRYAEAADEFAKVPEASRHADQARFRAVLCRRLALEAARGRISADEYLATAEKAALALLAYAEGTEKKAAAAPAADAKNLGEWAAAARVNAAELLLSQGVERFAPALEAVADFERRYEDSELVGRVLAVRIRAYRGLRQFEQATRILEQYLRTVSPERAVAVLASLAQGMQEEVERLQADGQADAARRLAGESLDTFAQLEDWVRRDAQRAGQAAVVAFARAQMLLSAGEFRQTQEIVSELLKHSPRNGNYQRLLAVALTAQLTPASPTAQVTAAQEAWGELLKDPNLRKRAPQRYWEARWHWLALLLRQGAAAEVDQAIRQEQVWYPDLGGSPWREKLLELRAQARAQAGLPPDDPTATAPVTAPAPALIPPEPDNP